MEGSDATRPGGMTVLRAMRPGVVSCAADASGETVARLMARHRVRWVAVVGDDDPKTWRAVDDFDLLRASRRARLDRLVASEVASPLPTIESDEALERAADLMAESGSRHLLVTDCDTAHPIGFVSALDVLAVLVEAERRQSGGGA